MLNMKAIAALCGALLIAALVAVVFMYRASAIKSEAVAERLTIENKELFKLNQQKDLALARIALQGEQNDKLLNTLYEQVIDINKGTALTQQQLKEVAKSNAEVKAYLTTKLPSAVSSLLNGKTGNGTAVSK